MVVAFIHETLLVHLDMHWTLKMWRHDSSIDTLSDSRRRLVGIRIFVWFWRRGEWKAGKVRSGAVLSEPHTHYSGTPQHIRLAHLLDLMVCITILPTARLIHLVIFVISFFKGNPWQNHHMLMHTYVGLFKPLKPLRASFYALSHFPSPDHRAHEFSDSFSVVMPGPCSRHA